MLLLADDFQHAKSAIFSKFLIFGHADSDGNANYEDFMEQQNQRAIVSAQANFSDPPILGMLRALGFSKPLNLHLLRRMNYRTRFLTIWDRYATFKTSDAHPCLIKKKIMRSMILSLRKSSN